MNLFYTGLVLFPAIGLVTILKVNRDYQGDKLLTTTTVALVWSLYIGHMGLTIYSAWFPVWQISIASTFTVMVGLGLLILGLGITVAGMLEFGSARRISGRRTDKLVTSGIYQWSRNPQNFGWFLILLGLSILGKSAGALFLTILFALFIHAYIVQMEEPFLERVYRDKYGRYKHNTARYIGRPMG